MKSLFLFFGLLYVFASASVADAQAQRYELGRRLRVFEECWEKTPGEDGRKSTVTPLNQAVSAFFTIRFGEAARAIDSARFALDPKTKPTPAKLWAESLALFPAGRFFDTNASEIAAECKAFYDVPRPSAVDFVLRLVLVTDGKEGASTTVKLAAMPTQCKLPLEKISEGDHRLHYEISAKDEKLAQGEIGVSFVKHKNDRVEKLKKVPTDKNRDLATEHATLESTLRILEKLKNGGVEETDYPAARLLREMESLQASIDAGAKFYTHVRRGETWLSLAVRAADAKASERVFPLRILVPAKWNDKSPPPLVVALHGAGGSENMFFDTYGDGKIVRQCQERGWMLVAPRVGFTLPLASILDDLHGRYPFDRTNVFLVGHSMGAGAAMQATSTDPKRYAGVAALGGSGTFKTTDALKTVPFYIGVGSQDFALAGARSLKDRLVKAGVANVTLSELPNIEHLGIVQQSLANCFEFFDAIKAKKAP